MKEHEDASYKLESRGLAEHLSERRVECDALIVTRTHNSGDTNGVIQHLGVEMLPPATDCAKKSIPEIDLKMASSQVAKALNSACREVGFFYVVNHGVSPELIASTLKAMRDFFATPTAVKQAVAMKASERGIRGYFGLGEEDLLNKDGLSRSSPSAIGDWKEGFDCGRKVSELEKSKCRLVDNNQWPSSLEFEPAVSAYRDALLGVALRVAKVLAIALGLRSNFFTDRLRLPLATLRLLHYPPTADELSCGPHTDYGCFTVLYQDSDGLEVKTADGQWVAVPARHDAFVVNLGDMMHRWTNAIYASTLHRVRAPHDRHRLSLALFVNPDVGVCIECLPTCCDAQNPPKFPPENAECILQRRYEDTFPHFAAKCRQSA